MAKEDLLKILSLPPDQQVEMVRRLVFNCNYKGWSDIEKTYVWMPDPMWEKTPLDWKLAKRMQAEAIEKYGYLKWNEACVAVFRKVFVGSHKYRDAYMFWRDHALPKHYIIASLICKLEP